MVSRAIPKRLYDCPAALSEASQSRRACYLLAQRGVGALEEFLLSPFDARAVFWAFASARVRLAHGPVFDTNPIYHEQALAFRRRTRIDAELSPALRPPRGVPFLGLPAGCYTAGMLFALFNGNLGWRLLPLAPPFGFNLAAFARRYGRAVYVGPLSSRGGGRWPLFEPVCPACTVTAPPAGGASFPAYRSSPWIHTPPPVFEGARTRGPAALCYGRMILPYVLYFPLRRLLRRMYG